MSPQNISAPRGTVHKRFLFFVVRILKFDSIISFSKIFAKVSVVTLLVQVKLEEPGVEVQKHFLVRCQLTVYENFVFISFH